MVSINLQWLEEMSLKIQKNSFYNSLPSRNRRLLWYLCNTLWVSFSSNWLPVVMATRVWTVSAVCKFILLNQDRGPEPVQTQISEESLLFICSSTWSASMPKIRPWTPESTRWMLSIGLSGVEAFTWDVMSAKVKFSDGAAGHPLFSSQISWVRCKDFICLAHLQRDVAKLERN